ncbi:methyltransferase domain-containing protein [Adlercreutzia sp. ZJ138]|uniref:methyltransferase domain-containing protein n=1 Tax=Adlercreutzia sp. ZJ138 TaxID=2709405 RepID=UPI0013EC3193|nr:methyltransferase domain-containing protein [Adlercreutzia sp. ZJ138]
MAEELNRQKPSEQELKSYYESLPVEGGFASACRMVLPVDELRGKRVLDVACRKGKGVYKLSELVGPDGWVIGVDWDSHRLDSARAGASAALERSGYVKSNMEFRQGFPEDLRSAGVIDASVDVAYVNSSVTLFFDQRRAIFELFRALVPGGLLVMETVFAVTGEGVVSDREAIVARARSLGNSIQAARTADEVFRWLREADFKVIDVVESCEVDPARGCTPDHTAATVSNDEAVRYEAVVIHARC